jgi:paraquat-inducible protein B
MSPAQLPELEENRTFNLFTSIWIVPLIALIISGWLVYQHFVNLGSEIRIDFPSSDGLIPGESVIKFRDVAIGKVMRIELQNGGEGVSVYARMNKESEPYLNQSTRFWIVSPQVDSSGVRGLDTLLHGTYIAMHAQRKGKLVTEFVGQEKPFRSDEEGKYVHLRTRKLGNVHVGAAIYYHNLRAGIVEKIDLDDDRRTTRITIFVEKSYANLINVTSKFWHQDLVALNMEGGQIALDLAPLSSVLLGSISFESKMDQSYPDPEAKHVFRLYDNRADALRQKVGGSVQRWERFTFAFSGEISGLHEGAPIRYQGFRIGEIDKAPIRYNSALQTMEADVVGLIDASVFDDTEHNGSTNLRQAVCKGLHAELKSNNPFIESLYIDLVYGAEANGTKACLNVQGDRVNFPTQKVVKNAILSRLDRLLVSMTKLAEDNRVPLRELLEKLKTSAMHLNTLMAKPSFQSLTDDLNTTMGSLGGLMGKSGGIDKALDELQKTLKTTKRVMRGYSSGSLFGKKLEAMLKEVGQTSEETKRLIEKLNKKPNALIFGD